MFQNNKIKLGSLLPARHALSNCFGSEDLKNVFPTQNRPKNLEMAYSKDSYQVVFLVDIRVGVADAEDDPVVEQKLNKVRLSALKVLTFLESTLPDSKVTSNLKWGFKFFNFHKFKSSIERYEFKEFSLRNFENFESLLETKNFNERQKVHESCQTRSDLSTTSGSSKSSSKGVEEGPIVHLTNALKEIVADYQWDSLDITSPVRPAKRRQTAPQRRSIDNEPTQYNYVFVIGSCPRTLEEWNNFAFISKENGGLKDAGGKAISGCLPCESSKFGEFVLPPVVYRLFSNEKRIKLFWLDTHGDQNPFQVCHCVSC